MTDSWTDELLNLCDKAEVLRFPVSRLLVNPERFEHDSDEPLAKRGMGAVYIQTHDGKRLKDSLVREELMAEFYKPHYTALEDWATAALEHHGRCLIIDCHSYSSVPLLCDHDQTSNRPDICIGTSEVYTPAGLIESTVAAFNWKDYSV